MAKKIEVNNFKQQIKDRRQWIIDQIEKTNKPHDVIKKEFLKHYPGQDKYFDKVVSQIVD